MVLKQILIIKKIISWVQIILNYITIIQAIEGIGPITASALVAELGNGSQFISGRQFAANLGLVPKQHSSGGKDKLCCITKRGDVYIRNLLIQGARAVLAAVKL